MSRRRKSYGFSNLSTCKANEIITASLLYEVQDIVTTTKETRSEDVWQCITARKIMELLETRDILTGYITYIDFYELADVYL